MADLIATNAQVDSHHDHECQCAKVDLAYVEEAVAKHGSSRRALIPLLQSLQDHYSYLPQEALDRLCETTEITPAQIEGVSSFYSEFRRTPAGKHRIRVCHGTACHVKGAQDISDAFARELGIPEGEDTDATETFTLDKVPCLGCCSLAVAVQGDEDIYGYVTTENVDRVLKDVVAQSAGKSAKGKSRNVGPITGEVRMCVDSCCVAMGSQKVYEAVEEALHETGIPAVLKRVGCVVVCHETPLIEIALDDGRLFRYGRVEPQDVRPILLRHFRPHSFVDKVRNRVSHALDYLLTDYAWQPMTRYSITLREPHNTAFLGPQKHLAMEHYGVLDPLGLEAYRARDGFAALQRCVMSMKPEQVIEEIDNSGLRGRGGGGFPSGKKWSLVAAAEGDQKFIVCNGDEGDPGAFMDRMLLESFPFRIIEGMAIAAYAVGAQKGMLYIRSEYPFAVDRMTKAIDMAKEAGVLGDNIFGTSFSLDLTIMRGAGAFVCGEETALIASLEGERGMPRLRPPYPAEAGYEGKPTLVNNVETYSLVSWIMRNGAEEFASIGTDKSKGTKVFALAGKTVRGGLVEVPMGTTIRQVVQEIGGGIADGKRFKAVLIGGPSGGCIPAELADTPIDYEALTGLGAMMGSGGLVVLDEEDCVVDMARYFLEFTQKESCGKCTFCRIGTKRLLEILERLCSGKGKAKDLDQLTELADYTRAGSLCGLGTTAPNPVLTTLRYFRDEYEAHIEGRCPAGKCKDMYRLEVNADCTGCTKCAQVCPVDAIEAWPYRRHKIDPEVCIRCGACITACPYDAIEKV